MKARRWLTPVIAAGLAASAAMPLSALALAPTKMGWWTQSQGGAATGSLLIPIDQTPGGKDLHVSNAGASQTAPNPGGVPPPPPPPASSGPTAISAVSYALPNSLPADIDSGTVIADLTLQVSTAGGHPVGSSFPIVACQILSPWLASDGGDWGQRPSYRQGGCIEGQLSADGTTMGFTLVAAIASRRTVDLALVPAIGNPQPFQIQFAPPGASSLQLKPLPAPRPVTFVAPPAESGSLVGLGSNTPGGALPPLSGEAVQPGVPPPPGGAQPAASTVAGPAVVRPGAAVAAAIADRRLILLILVLVLLLFVTQWTAAGRRMVAFERAAVRGVGRFSSPRATAPLPL